MSLSTFAFFSPIGDPCRGGSRSCINCPLILISFILFKWTKSTLSKSSPTNPKNSCLQSILTLKDTRRWTCFTLISKRAMKSQPKSEHIEHPKRSNFGPLSAKVWKISLQNHSSQSKCRTWAPSIKGKLSIKTSHLEKSVSCPLSRS